MRYEVSDLGTVAMNCCLTAYNAGFPAPSAADRVSGDGTIVVLTYTIRAIGAIDLSPGVGLLGAIIATSYPAQITIGSR